MTIEKLQPIFFDEFSWESRKKINEIIDAVNALQDSCMPGFRSDIKEKPLNCPFCGNKPEVSHGWCPHDGCKIYEIQCRNDECAIRPGSPEYCKTIEECIAAWNKRG